VIVVSYLYSFHEEMPVPGFCPGLIAAREASTKMMSTEGTTGLIAITPVTSALSGIVIPTQRQRLQAESYGREGLVVLRATPPVQTQQR
jgi:hypothetical protein